MCHTVALIPKGKGDFWGIGLIKVIWMAVLVMKIVWIGLAVDFHNTLHRFRAGNGTVTISLKVKLIHQMTVMREEFL